MAPAAPSAGRRPGGSMRVAVRGTNHPATAGPAGTHVATGRRR
jgi:hypothetical protein